MNLGNRLQNYALQEVLRGMGCQVETIHRDYKKVTLQRGIYDPMTFANALVGSRKGLYLRFDKNIAFSRFRATPNETDSGLNDHYDVFVSGSDQVWNPCYDKYVGLSDLLAFADPPKRTAYAASFGVDTVPDEKKDAFIKNLSQFRAISVREKAGAKLVKDFTGRDAAVTLDPTLLLGADQWRKVEKKPRYLPKQKYVLIYALSGVSESMRRMMEQMKAPDLFFYDILALDARGKRPAVGPAEFIYLVDHADGILTDSFHATVFSVLFGKKVCTCPRDGIDMSSRIVSLAETLGLKESIDGQGVFQIDDAVDYHEVMSRLEQARQSSLRFLDTVVKG